MKYKVEYIPERRLQQVAAEAVTSFVRHLLITGAR